MAVEQTIWIVEAKYWDGWQPQRETHPNVHRRWAVEEKKGLEFAYPAMKFRVRKYTRKTA